MNDDDDDNTYKVGQTITITILKPRLSLWVI